MFKECLIDIDFNLLVLNIASLFEISLLPGPTSLSAGVWVGPRCWGPGIPSLLFWGCCFIREGHGFGCSWCYPALAAVVTGTATVLSPAGPRLPARPPPQTHPSEVSLWETAQITWGIRCSAGPMWTPRLDCGEGPSWAFQGCPGTPPARERLCLWGWCGSTRQLQSLIPPPSCLTSHTQDTWDVS